MREEQPKHMVPAGDSHRQIGRGVLPAAIAGSVLFSAAMATPRACRRDHGGRAGDEPTRCHHGPSARDCGTDAAAGSEVL